MKIQILGTAAAEGVPALFCNCDTCKRSRKSGGRNIRSRSSIQIDDILKIDLPPDAFHHSVKCQLDTSLLKYLLITHSHHDHFAKSELYYLRPGFATRDKLPELCLYANADVIAMTDIFSESPVEIPLKRYTVKPFEPFQPGPYKVTPLRAMHGTEKDPLNYIIEKDGLSLLYTCDSGFYEDKTWDFLAGCNIKLNLVISECTGGPDRVEYKTHMGLPNVCEFRQKTLDIGLTNSKTKWILTHFTHNCGTTYDEMVKIAEPQDFTVAYDGMVINP